jgi:hypothetical protein
MTHCHESIGLVCSLVELHLKYWSGYRKSRASEIRREVDKGGRSKRHKLQTPRPSQRISFVVGWAWQQRQTMISASSLLDIFG